MKLLFLLFLLCMAACAFGEDFLGTYSDMSQKDKWLKENIEKSRLPPVHFVCAGKDSDTLRWTKAKTGERTVTDYAASDLPAERKVAEYSYTAGELLLTLRVTTYPGFPVAEYEGELINLSDSNSPEISDIDIINASVGQDSSVLVHYNRGSNQPCSADEYEPLTHKLTSASPFEFRISNGLPTSDALPYFNLEGKNRGVISGINWQGNWHIKACSSKNGVKITAGQGTTDFVLLPRETYRLPGMVLLFYKNADWQYGQNIWRRWMLKHNLMRYSGRRDYRENAYLCSGFEGYEKDMEHITRPNFDTIGQKYGATYVYDWGWSDQTRTKGFETGNWNPSALYPDDSLAGISDVLHSKNIGSSIWLEPERCFRGTDTALALGDENLIYDDGDCALINYGKTAVEDYVVNLVDGLVKKYHMTMYRQDFNFENEPYWTKGDRIESEKLNIPRRGLTENHACTGYINAFRRIQERNPSLLFDVCAGGGRRYDLESSRFGFMHTKSDFWWSANACQSQNFGCYSWNVMIGTGFQNPSSLYVVRSRVNASVGMSGNPGASYMSALAEWHDLHEFMWNDFYQISDYTLESDGSIAMQWHDHENNKGMMTVYLRQGGAFRVYPKALEENTVYKISDRDGDPDRFVTGKAMMTNGVLAVRGNEPSAVILYYEPTDQPAVPENDAALLAEYQAKELPPYETANDMEKLSELYKSAGIGPKGIKYLMPDFCCSGGIYGIGKELFDILSYGPFADRDGWKPLNPQRTHLEVSKDNLVWLYNWTLDWYFCLRPYAIKYKDCYFMWLGNSFSFGDPDGQMVTKERRMAFDKEGDLVYSDPFELVVCDYTRPGFREVQFSSYTEDGGAVYCISEKLYKNLARTDTTKSIDGTEYKALDRECCRIVYNDVLQGPHPELFTAEKEGRHYMYISNRSSLELCDRVKLSWIENDKAYYTMFYFVGKTMRGGASAPVEMDWSINE